MKLSKDRLKEFEKEIHSLSNDELDKYRHHYSMENDVERIFVIEKRIDELIDEIFKDGPAEELNKLLEHEFRMKKHPKAFVAKCACFFLLVIAFVSYLKENNLSELIRSFSIGCSAILYGIISITEKRFRFFADLYHKKAYPIKYWVNVCLMFVLGFFFISVLGLHCF